jgi:diguanylate cyclase (GGDEF)-like protein/PAS domain S-box-containing protein
MAPVAVDPTDRARSRRAVLSHALRRTVVAVLAALVPLAFFGSAYQAESMLAGSAAAVASQQLDHIAGQGRDWRAEAALLAASADGSMHRVVLDADGGLVARSGTPVVRPSLLRRAAFGAEGTAGWVVVERSLWPALGTALAAAVLAGLLTLASVRLPRRRYGDEVGTTRATGADVNGGPNTVLRHEGWFGAAHAAADPCFLVLFEHSREGILTLRRDGIVLRANAAAARIFGSRVEDLPGSALSALAFPDAASTVALLAGTWETQARRASGVAFPLEITLSAAQVGGEGRWIAILRDVTERRATQDRLAYLANYDSLTGLPNRALFRDRLAEVMKRAKRSGRQMGLMFLDLDRFKVINDSLGHAAGDQLLQQVAKLLTRSLRSVDSLLRSIEPDGVTVSRLGGDEFTIIVKDINTPEDAAIIARRIIDALIEPFRIEGQELFITTSIGISLYPCDDTDLDGLIRHTDMAMYRSKAHGGSTYSFYSSDMSAEVAARLSLEASLRHALERGEFLLHYQPKADLRTGKVTGVEALLRWNRPGEGLVPPDRFIALLEDTGLILTVGAWVIRTACAEVASWSRLPGMAPLTLAVNLSARQMREPRLKQLIADTLLDTGIAPQRLELELTESQLIEDSDRSRALLSSLAELGVRVAIDDFGTGHSSLSYLKRFSIDTLKIDRSFVREITASEEDSAIAAAVVALGRSLGLKVVAEGVETLHQADCLRSLGCDEVQGYLLSRPLAAPELLAWLKDYRSTRSFLKVFDPHSPSAPMPLLSVEDMALTD